ncbi:hypothetical protein GJ744_000336 [Endocarpon pusillum]|uniref:Clr5 domain-containing protein n=1 Tax=Endocarpon pusillum TaxID=364733 RepID=A0A8H7E711_9EURO|nr:hypothetical protein GJ744_000336 [Endocarpon pusillum]
MKLDALIEFMARSHNFNASRHQYKLRFQKWHLPSLEAFTALQEGSNGSRNIDRRISAEDRSFETSRPESAMQDVSDLGELPPEELFAGLDFGSGIQVSRSKARSKSSQDETLPESQVISYESDPKVDATPTANITSATMLESDDDKPATVVVESYLEDKIGTGRPTSIRVRIRPPYQHSRSESSFCTVSIFSRSALCNGSWRSSSYSGVL